MADIFAEVDEVMKQERLQSLWEKYGILVIGAIALIIGWTIFSEVSKNWKDSKNLDQTNVMITLLEGENTAEVIKGAQDLQPGLKGLTLLDTAGNLARENKLEEAFKIYSELASDSSMPQEIRSLADFMVLRMMPDVQIGKDVAPEKIIAGLEKIWNNPDSPFRYHARLEAAIILAKHIGNYTDAKTHLTILMADKGVPPTLRQKAVSLDLLYSLKASVADNKEE